MVTMPSEFSFDATQTHEKRWLNNKTNDYLYYTTINNNDDAIENDVNTT